MVKQFLLKVSLLNKKRILLFQDGSFLLPMMEFSNIFCEDLVKNIGSNKAPRGKTQNGFTYN